MVFPKVMIADMEEQISTDGVVSSNVQKHKTRPILMKTYKTAKSTYKVLYYEKGFVCKDDTVSPLYRSLVLDASTNSVYSYSVPKAVNWSTFISDRSEINYNAVLVNEIVEGTMINLWFDPTSQMWKISTKHAVGGEYTFFRKILEDDSAISNPEKESGFLGKYNFLRMFIDALHGPNTPPPDNQPDQDDIASIYLHHLVETPSHSGFFKRDCVYSFVMQHPENHLVLKIEKPQLYLTHVIRVQELEDGGTAADVTLMTERPANLPEHIAIPRIYGPGDYASYTDIQVAATARGASDSVGIMVTDLSTGSRSKMVFDAYLRRKEIRGNNPNMLFQYLCLLRLHKITEFLRYFPWYKDMFNRFRKQYVTAMMNVHKAYVSRYIKRKGEVIAPQYMPHVWRIHHNVFLPSMASGQKQIVTIDVVHDYFRNLSPIEIFYMLSYKGDKGSKTSAFV